MNGRGDGPSSGGGSYADARVRAGAVAAGGDGGGTHDVRVGQRQRGPRGTLRAAGSARANDHPGRPRSPIVRLDEHDGSNPWRRWRSTRTTAERTGRHRRRARSARPRTGGKNREARGARRRWTAPRERRPRRRRRRRGLNSRGHGPRAPLWSNAPGGREDAQQRAPRVEDRATFHPGEGSRVQHQKRRRRRQIVPGDPRGRIFRHVPVPGLSPARATSRRRIRRGRSRRSATAPGRRRATRTP